MLIYVFIDNVGEPYYVGKTKNFTTRQRRHRWEIKRQNSLPNYNKARKLEKLGHPFTMAVLEDGIEEIDINKKETYYISKLREDGKSLCNLTDGGEGISSEMAKIIRAKRVNNKHSEETKRKMSETKKGMSFTDEHKINLSKAWNHREPMSLESRRKQSQTAKGKINIQTYKLISPDGKEYITKSGLTIFCEEHNLTRANLYKVLCGQRKHHKGWRIEYVQQN